MIEEFSFKGFARSLMELGRLHLAKIKSGLPKSWLRRRFHPINKFGLTLLPLCVSPFEKVNYFCKSGHIADTGSYFTVKCVCAWIWLGRKLLRSVRLFTLCAGSLASDRASARGCNASLPAFCWHVFRSLRNFHIGCFLRFLLLRPACLLHLHYSLAESIASGPGAKISTPP